MTGPTTQQFFQFDGDAYNIFQGEVRDIKNLNFFQRVYVSPRALLSMLKHSLTTSCEIMGILAGQATRDGNFYVTNAVPFAVEGTETRVGATDDCWGDWFAYTECCQQFHHPEVAAGWYHSHPGLLPYMSEIDVRTHRMNQQMNHAFVALVIDPKNTVSDGKLQLGGYRTYPEDPKRDSEPVSNDLVLKYGTAAHKYYELDIIYFKSPLDTAVLSDITTRSYGQAISCSPLQLNAEYIGGKVKEVADGLAKLGTSQERPTELETLTKTIQRVNEDRRTGLWVERMKRAAFG
jgi:COP9 signalosome complex subunit 5